MASKKGSTKQSSKHKPPAKPGSGGKKPVTTVNVHKWDKKK